MYINFGFMSKVITAKQTIRIGVTKTFNFSKYDSHRLKLQQVNRTVVIKLDQ